MREIATCKNCGYQWEKGTDSGHGPEDCIERLRAENQKLKESRKGFAQVLKEIIDEHMAEGRKGTAWRIIREVAKKG